MLRHKPLVLVLLALAVPATAQTFGFPAGQSAACVAIGDTRYRIAAADEHADYVVRIDPAAAAPDIRVAMTETVDEADFVFVEESAGGRCSGGKRVKIDPAAAVDLTIGFAPAAEPADYRIYLRSSSLSPQAAAALYAAAHLPARRQARANDSTLSGSR